jgi:hypothetical protein
MNLAEVDELKRVSPRTRGTSPSRPLVLEPHAPLRAAFATDFIIVLGRSANGNAGVRQSGS